MKIRLALILIAISAIFLVPLNVLACACCAEKGFYSIWTGKPDGYNLEVLEKINFAENAELYLNAAGYDDIKGLPSISAESEGNELWKFNLVDSFIAKTWKFDFKDANGKTGSFRLPLPTKMVSFKVDIHDGDEANNEPVLYKEWRFKGNVQSGTGFFGAGIVNPTTYFLVLQGRGNGCDNVEDFTHWRLEIEGKKANYSFLGKLESKADSMPGKE